MREHSPFKVSHDRKRQWMTTAVSLASHSPEMTVFSSRCLLPSNPFTDHQLKAVRMPFSGCVLDSQTCSAASRADLNLLVIECSTSVHNSHIAYTRISSKLPSQEIFPPLWIKNDMGITKLFIFRRYHSILSLKLERSNCLHNKSISIHLKF